MPQGFEPTPTNGNGSNPYTVTGSSNETSSARNATLKDVLQPRFSSKAKLKTAYYNWLENQTRDDAGEDDQGGDPPVPKKANLTGSISVPNVNTLRPGQKFGVQASAKNTGNAEVVAKFVPAIEYKGQVAALAESVSATLPPGESEEFEFTVPRGQFAPPAGDYKIFLAASTADGTGYVAKTTVTVSQPEGEDDRNQNDKDQSSDWSPYEHARQLPGGWHLYQSLNRESGDVRYIIAGNTKDGKTVFLAPSGRPQDKPHVYTKTENVIKAIRKYLELLQGGKIDESKAPSEDSERPNDSTVNEAANTSSTGGMTAWLDKVTGGNAMAAVLVAVVVVGYFLHQKGYLGSKGSKKGGGS